VWARLVEQDRDFLHWQLRNSNVEVVLLNGASVVRWVRQVGLVAGFDEDSLVYLAKNGNGTIRVYRAAVEGVSFLGWNRPLAGALATDGRQRLTRWVSEVLRERVSATVETGTGAMAAVGLLNGFVPVGTTVDGAAELEGVLAYWVEASNQATVGEVGAFGGSPAIIVRMGGDVFVLNRDTKRAAVRAFLAAAAAAGGADHLPWHVAANSRGTINRVTYRRDDGATPGWYAYLRTPSATPRELG